MPRKVFVEILALHRPDGSICPLELVWEDGRRFKIDKVNDIRQAASLKAGGLGIRYSCTVNGRDLMLYDDFGVWFVEADSYALAAQPTTLTGAPAI